MAPLTPDPRPWDEEDFDERIEEMLAEPRWVLPAGYNGVVRQDGGHLVVLHASALHSMLATIQHLRGKTLKVP